MEKSQEASKFPWHGTMQEAFLCLKILMKSSTISFGREGLWGPFSRKMDTAWTLPFRLAFFDGCTKQHWEIVVHQILVLVFSEKEATWKAHSDSFCYRLDMGTIIDNSRLEGLKILEKWPNNWSLHYDFSSIYTKYLSI